jgi:hypothetical protein
MAASDGDVAAAVLLAGFHDARTVIFRYDSGRRWGRLF